MFKSKGIKRKLTTLLASVIEVLQVVPGTASVLPYLVSLNSLLGGVAVTHAGVSGTLSQEKIAGAVSALYGIIFLAHFVPFLLPALPFLYKAASILAVARVGKEVIE